MKFIREHMKTEFWKLHVKLQYVVFDITVYIKKTFAKEITVTSVYRPGDKGVHGCFRGLDFRSHGFTKEQIDSIINYINSTWIYDYKREDMKVIIFHDVGKGEHFHVQVHPNTKLIFKKE